MANYAGSRFTLNLNAVKKVDAAALAALELTVEALHTELVNAGVMPFDTGNMQNDSTFVDTSDIANGRVSLVTATPYARRLYYHPEYDFQTVNNARARGEWLEPWRSGAHKDFLQNAYAAFLKELSGA